MPRDSLRLYSSYSYPSVRFVRCVLFVIGVNSLCWQLVLEVCISGRCCCLSAIFFQHYSEKGVLWF